ncbi:N-acetylglucosamine-6-phosphate deacetylase [Mycetocola sp. CAN_C7]|uniref:N-acetylglucosamine-6-phosphate deacetylase n=1 Tax=Mycetocola sp. CAN_C7 TaxID=2787724 RepID=UPI001A1AC745
MTTASAAPFIVHSATLIADGTVSTDGWVAVSDGIISEVGIGTGWHSRFPDATPTVVDAGGAYLSPGFIDIHCHGGGGRSFGDDVDGIRTALAVHRAAGTTRSVLSLVTAPVDELITQLGVIADLAAADATILGSHLEGPFLDPGHKGAHDPALLRAPDSDTVARLIDAARGTLRQVTLAPELPGGLDAIRQLADAGVTAAIGHTDADVDQARHAFDAGAGILTHAFNAMNGLHHRAPGPVAAATSSESVVLELINDGVHVHPEVVRIAFAAAPGRIALVTDAMAAAGSDDGVYRLGTLDVTVTDGVARLSDGSSIAGSTLTLDAALRRAVTEVGISLADAVSALTATPARAIGRGADLGRIAAGYAADLVLLDADLSVTAVWAAGERLR